METTTGTPTDPFGYNAKWGYYFDREAGVYKCTFRDYEPVAGRWLTRDAISYFGGINLYGYVSQSENLHRDELGFQAEEILEEAAPELIDKAADVLEAVGSLLESTWRPQSAREPVARRRPRRRKFLAEQSFPIIRQIWVRRRRLDGRTAQFYQESFFRGGAS
jgi:RHS repeat-associated protein